MPEAERQQQEFYYGQSTGNTDLLDSRAPNLFPPPVDVPNATLSLLLFTVSVDRLRG